MAVKRKHDALSAKPIGINSTSKPAAGTRTFATGKAVREGLSSGGRQAVVAFHQQILTPQSSLPLPISYPVVVIIQHYLDVSPSCEEIFYAWKEGDRVKDDSQTTAAVSLMAQIIRILAPIPFFRNPLNALVTRLLQSQEPWSDLLNRMIQSDKRDCNLAGLALAAAAINVEPPDVGSSGHLSGRLAAKVWTALVEGGTAKTLDKMIGMRRRNKDGQPIYRDKDPLDKPDIRHLCIDVVCPVMSLPSFHAFSKSILKQLYAGLPSDPAITIYRVLEAAWKAISHPSGGQSRKMALLLLDEHAIERLLELLERDDVEETTGKTVAEIVGAFLDATTTIPGKGICFQDQGWYPRSAKENGSLTGRNDLAEEDGNPNERARSGLHNRILSNVVRKQGSRVVDDKGRIGAWVVKVLQACPEIISGYWAHSALGVEPRLHAKWIATMTYIGKIVSLPTPRLSTFHQPIPRGSSVSTSPLRSPPQLNVVIESVLPSPLLRVHVTKGLQHADGLVQLVTAQVLAQALNKLEAVLVLLRRLENESAALPSSSGENPWRTLQRELEMEARRRTPEIQVIIAFAQKSATMAPLEPETEADNALVAKSTMLTETALRLFGLYYRTMPTISAEVKFDVGRLLVSSSSNKQERRERKEARSGSVVSETGSLRSVGTAGTAGMGGGFGYARGNVKGFEALSQVHVVQLLTDVTEWQWQNKAAGSQYTYLYHILQLHLATRQPIAQKMTTNLLHSLITPTLLFDHDVNELSIWLECLPRLSDTPQGVIQQVHLLSFLDDCFRRCLKTPYRYLEDIEAVMPGHFSYQRRSEMPSPLLMTMLEQLSAKVAGMHIGTDAAIIVVNYLRRVLLLLLGEQEDIEFASAIVGRLEAIVAKVHEAQQSRPGFEEAVTAIRHDIDTMSGNATAVELSDDSARLTDEPGWSENNFERLCLEGVGKDPKAADRVHLEDLALQGDVQHLARYARIVNHLLTAYGIEPSTKIAPSFLQILGTCLRQLASSQERASVRAKEVVFASDWLKSSILRSDNATSATAINELVSVLQASRPEDRAIASPFVVELSERIIKDKKSVALEQNLADLRPWTPFFEPAAAEKLLGKILKRSKKGLIVHEQAKGAIAGLVAVLSDATTAFRFLPLCDSLGLYAPFLALLERDVANHRPLAEIEDAQISTEIVKRFVSSHNPQVLRLLAAIVARFPQASAASRDALRAIDIGSWSPHDGVFPVIAAILKADPTIFDTHLEAASQHFVSRLLSPARPVVVDDQSIQALIEIIAVLVDRPQSSSSSIGDIIRTSITLSSCKGPASALTRKLAQTRSGASHSFMSHLVEVGLQVAVRLCSSDAELSSMDVTLLEDLVQSLRALPDLPISLSSAEAVVTAVVSERLASETAVALAAILAGRCEIRASSVRQHLQTIFSSKPLQTFSFASTPSTLKEAWVDLLVAIFKASPYASCQPNFIELLMPLYGATLSPADQKILSVFRLFETQRKVSSASMLRHWSASQSVSSRGLDAILSLDPQAVFATCCAFPLRRTLREPAVSSWNSPNTLTLWTPETSNSVDPIKVYDPAFVLPLLASVLLDGEIRGLDWVEILRSNVLGLAICALSSRDAPMRQLAANILAKTIEAISTCAFFERDQLRHTLDLLRHAIPQPADGTEGASAVNASAPAVVRLPTLPTLFLAHALRAQANPGHCTYPLISHFLLQRPVFDLFDVPMLYSMLYSATDDFKRERSWLVKLLRDGVRSEADWRILERRQTWSLLATVFSSSYDLAYRRLLLQAMHSFTLIPLAARTLVFHHGFIPWLAMQWTATKTRDGQSRGRNSREDQASVLGLLENVVISCAAEETRVPIKANGVNGDSPEQQSVRSSSAEQPQWVYEAMILIELALKDADASRFDLLSRIMLRISQVPAASTLATPDLLPCFAQRLSELESMRKAKPESRSTTDEAVQHLFRVGLSIKPELVYIRPKVQNAVREIGARAGRLATSLGEWVRTERTKALWDDKAGVTTA